MTASPRHTALLLALVAVVPVIPVVPLLGGAGCSTAPYLWEQGGWQLHILRARRRIPDVLADPATSDDTRARLRLARRARDFGVQVLGLHGGDAYTRYLDTGDQPIAWSVYAAYPDRLKPYLHRFPIAGAIPYLGFFDHGSAEREQGRLARMGLDTYLAPVSGYSTLGFFADPVFSSMLEGPDVRIVEVVLHEMLHGTIYRAGHSDWNESLATIVGYEGAAAFFRAQIGEADALAEALEENEERQRKEDDFADFLAPVVETLEALYSQRISKQEKQLRRQAIFDRAMEDYRARFPRPSGEKKPKAFSRQPLNNAVILAFTTYHRSQPALRAELLAMGGDLPTFIAYYRRKYGN